ncbi:MAG: hypothetical protein Q9214_004663, partial [Letrouitia sp. 1 TL-2023]
CMKYASNKTATKRRGDALVDPHSSSLLSLISDGSSFPEHLPMERPPKRRRLFESANPVLEIAERRALNDLKLKSRFESIFEKYGRDFSGIGDEIDFEKEEIVVDNGHIKGMVNERDIGGNEGASTQRHKDQPSGNKNTTFDGPSVASGRESSEENPLCSLEPTINSSAHRRRNGRSESTQSETVELKEKRKSRPEKYLSPEIIKAPPGENVVVQPRQAEYRMEAAWRTPLLPIDKTLLNRSHTSLSIDDNDLYSDSESDLSLSPFGRSLWAVNNKWTKEEDDLIRDLKASESLQAADIHDLFPGRTLSALKQRWSGLPRGALRKTDNAMSSSIPKSSPIVTKKRSVVPRHCQSESRLNITSQSMHRRSEHPETNDSDGEDILASSGPPFLVSRQGDLKWTPRPKTPSSQEMGNRESQGSQHTVEEGRNIDSEGLTREQLEVSGALGRSITIGSELLPSIAADSEKANQYHPSKEARVLDYSQPFEMEYSQKSCTSSIPEDTRRLENAKETAQLSYLTPESQGSESEHDPPRAVRKRGRPQHPSNCSGPNQAATSQTDLTSSSLTRSGTVATDSKEGKKRKTDVMDYESSNRHIQDRNSCRKIQSEKHQTDQPPTHGVLRMGLRPRKPRNKPSAPGSQANAHGKSVDFIPKVQRHSQVTAGSNPATTSVDKVVIDLTGCDDTSSCSDHENQAVTEGFQNSVVGGGGKSTEVSKNQPNNDGTPRVIVLISKLPFPDNSSEDQSTSDAIDTAALEKAELPSMLPECHSPLVECSEISVVEADDGRDHFHPPIQRFRASNAFERRQLHTTGPPFSLPFTPENRDLSDDELFTPVKAIRQQNGMTPVLARSWP